MGLVSQNPVSYRETLVVDLVISGGRVVDGSGAPPRVADVAVEGDRIVGVGEGFRGRRQIDARGKVVTPGFIDIHTHTDFTLPVEPSATAKLLQGVTTDVTGNCGFSPFPLADGGASSRHGAFVEPALTTRWASLKQYAEALADLRPGINVAPLVGHGAVRLAVLGEEDRAPTPSETAAMRALVERSMEDGAFGVSSGLVYAPSSYADTSELIALAEVAGSHGGFYATHLRDEGDGLLEAVNEALAIGRSARCPVQLSHHKVLGRRNWGLVGESLRRVDEANAGGEDVTLDVYPYTAGSTTLITLLPPEELSVGEPELRRRLADPAFRARVAERVRTTAQFQLDEVQLAAVPSRPDASGRRVVDVAEQDGIDPAELVIQLIETDGSSVVMLGFGMDEADVRRVICHPRSMIGSDGWVLSTAGPGHAHPRNFGCAPRVLANYVRDERIVDIETAVAKLAGLPAARLGLTDRGTLAEGMVADVVVLDLERLEEGSTYASPDAYPVGVEHVVLNGALAVTEGEPTGGRAGRVLRPSRNAGGTTRPRTIEGGR